MVEEKLRTEEATDSKREYTRVTDRQAKAVKQNSQLLLAQNTIIGKQISVQDDLLETQKIVHQTEQDIAKIRAKTAQDKSIEKQITTKHIALQKSKIINQELLESEKVLADQSKSSAY